jgi:hypothetical protein
MEQWKPIPGYEGLYDASTHGRIRSTPGKITSNAQYSQRVWKSRILKGRGDKWTPGRRVSLWKDGQCKDLLVARLVAVTFLGAPPAEDWTVNHKNGNRLDNRIDNLEWLTRADNIRHSFETGIQTSQKLTRLIGDGEVLSFRSMTLAGYGIGRNHGYIHDCLKKNKRARSADGRYYKIEVV